MAESIKPVAPPAEKQGAKEKPRAPDVAEKEVPSPAAPPAEKPKTKLGTFLAEIPKPFRPRHLEQAVRLHAVEAGLSDEETAKIDPHRFQREHGLPNPMKRYRVKGMLGKEDGPVDEFEAVDESDATAQYRAKHAKKNPHKCRCKVFLEDY